MSYQRKDAFWPTSTRSGSAPHGNRQPAEGSEEAGAVRNLRSHLRLLQGMRQSTPTLPPPAPASPANRRSTSRLPPLNSRPSPPVAIEEEGHELNLGMPTTTPERRGIRMLQGLRRSAPLHPSCMEPMSEEAPIMRSLRRASSTRSKRVRSSVDAMASQACSTGKEEVTDRGQSSNDALTASRPANSEASGSVQRDLTKPAPVQDNETQPDVAAQEAAVKQQAVMALQKLFFEELQKGADPNAAAAQALIRLNQKRIESIDAAESVHDPIYVRPPTPLIGGPRGQLAIRVGIQS
jgi:hypothetical protein